MSLFAKQMALQPDTAAPGRYIVEVDPRWNCPINPQGGVMAAITAAAMDAELGNPDQRLLSLTTVFAAQVPAGPVVVEATVLRRGRTMSQALATVRTPGSDAGHTSVAVFGRERAGFEFTDLAMPDVPGPADCPSFRDPPPPGTTMADFGDRPPFPLWEHVVEGRAALGHAPWDDYMPDSSECAYWYRLDESPMRDDGTLDPLAVVALSDLMPSSVRERMGPGTPPSAPPSADLTVHLLGDASSTWLLSHQRARRATRGYASIECALWDEGGELVAHAAQMMFLSFPEGPPVGDERLPRDMRG
jgi:acyl-CoA thioesterase